MEDVLHRGVMFFASNSCTLPAELAAAEDDVRFVAFLMALAGLAGMAPAPASAQTDTVMILDASGSMWGQVDGRTKISAARQAVDSILSKWKPNDRLGLMAYGHRTKGDCKDIEMLVPVGSFDPARIKTAVAALNPKGKTPMAESLRAAAAALKTTENKGTVVLVSDGIETCVADPCAVAAELKKAGIGLVAHVIGFDVTDPAAKAQLQCIARATGGVYLDARDASGLENALGRAVEATQGAPVKTEAPPKPAADPYAGKNIRGVARLAAGLDPIADQRSDVHWAFFQSRGGEKGEFVTAFYNSPFADTIEPGDYVLEVEYGYAKATQPVRVEKGKPTILDVALDAGYVTSEGATLNAGKTENPTWEVLRGGDVLTTDYAPVPRFILPAGDYVMRLSKGNSKVEKAFTLAAGDTVNLALTLDVGKLLVSGVYAPGGPKVENGISVEIRHPPQGDAEQGEWVTTVYDALSRIDLQSGPYDVIVKVGEAQKTVRAEVKSGVSMPLAINLDAGVLGLKAGQVRSIEIVQAERDINNERKLVHTSFDPELNLALNAGKYVAVVQYADDRKVEKEFTISAGKRTDVEVKP